MTGVDAVQVILAHMDQQHSSTLERYEAILDQLERGGVTGDNEVGDPGFSSFSCSEG